MAVYSIRAFGLTAVNYSKERPVFGHVQNCTFARDVALELSRAHTNNPPGPRNHSYEIGPLTISRAHGAQNSEARSSG